MSNPQTNISTSLNHPTIHLTLNNPFPSARPYDWEEFVQEMSSSIHALVHSQLTSLRTVPTKYKGFCARLGPRGKSRPLQGLLESTKKNVGSHAFFRDNQPWTSTKMLTSAFFWKKEGNDISSQISLEFAFTYRKANTFKRIFKLHGKW